MPLLTLEKESVRETGELLKTAGSGGERCVAKLSSGLVFNGKSTVVCGTKNSQRVPHLTICSLFCSTGVVKCLLMTLGQLNHPLKGKEKLEWPSAL